MGMPSVAPTTYILAGSTHPDIPVLVMPHAAAPGTVNVLSVAAEPGVNRLRKDGVFALRPIPLLLALFTILCQLVPWGLMTAKILNAPANTFGPPEVRRWDVAVVFAAIAGNVPKEFATRV